MNDKIEKKMKSKLYLMAALVLTAVVTGGMYASTYATTSATFGITAAEGDMSTVEDAVSQPDWEDVIETIQDTEILRPDAVGTYSQCDPIGASPNYACVDEETADEDSTYVRTWYGATQLDTYNIADHSEGEGAITAVTVYIRTRVTSDSHAVEVALRTNGTDYFGTYTPISSTSYTNISAIWTENPSTESAWTWDEIDALEIGVRHYDLGSGYLMTTQVWAEVDYEYLPITGDVPTGDLFEVTPHTNYTGDLSVKVYLANTGNLTKAYDYLNMQLYLEGSVEAGETPDYQLLTLENGVATFTLLGGGGISRTLSVIGDDYGLVSGDTSGWEEGWTVTPELYCEVTQR